MDMENAEPIINRKLATFLICITCLVATVFAQDHLKAAIRQHTVSLAWTASTSAGVTYNVYRTQMQRFYKRPLATGVQATAYDDNSVRSGQTYWYIVKAYDPKTKNESVASNETQAVIP